MYVDTSVVVKLYTREPDSEACEAVAAGHRLYSSELLYGELYSALLAKERNGKLSARHRQLVWQTFEIHLLDDRLELVPLDGQLVRDAAEIMARVHPEVSLRTLDALHLASFQSVDAGPLFTRDIRMRDAGKQLGFALAE